MTLLRGILPSINLLIFGLVVLFASGPLWAADQSGPMTLEKFREITSSAGDSVPLEPMLAKVPWWSNTVTSCVATNFATDSNGQCSKLVLHRKARTVKGKYIVFSEAETNIPGQNALEAYDERSSAYRFYFTSGIGPLATITEGTTVYDFTNKTYSYTTTFDDMKVIGNGSYSNAHESETSFTYSDNRLLVIDVQETEPVSAEQEAADYYNQGLQCQNVGDLGGALTSFTKAIELKPNDANAYWRRGSLKHLAGDFDGAIADYNKVIELKPDFAFAYSDRAGSKWANHDSDGAVADCNTAIKLDPTLARAYDLRGNLEDMKGESEKAISDYTRAIQIMPIFPAAYYNRGIAKQRTGDLTGAKADYDKAIALGPKAIQGDPPEKQALTNLIKIAETAKRNIVKSQRPSTSAPSVNTDDVQN
jgi:tetratricopeptide (TPR) repeat protein